MFNLSDQMEKKVKNLIEEMAQQGAEYREVPNTKDFYVTTKKNKKDLLLGKTQKEGKTFFLYQESSL